MNQLSRFIQHPQEPHQQAAKGVMRYLKKTSNMGVFYPAAGSPDPAPLQLVGYTDSDWGSDVET
jgi:hypothetical protein